MIRTYVRIQSCICKVQAKSNLNMVEEASPSSLAMMATGSNCSATYLLLTNISLLVCFDVLYYIHSLASAPRKILFFSLRRHSMTVQFSILGLALAVTLHKIVTNLIVHQELFVGCARDIYYIFAHFAPVIGSILLSAWVVILGIAPVLKWYPAMRRMLCPGPDAPAEKHVSFGSWSYEERLVLGALEPQRQQKRQQHSNEKEASDIEKCIYPATNESDFYHAAEPDQVLRENAESESICALIGLNSLWLVLAVVEWYMATGEFDNGKDFSSIFINIQVVHLSFLSLYCWIDCLITWGEVLVEAQRAQY